MAQKKEKKHFNLVRPSTQSTSSYYYQVVAEAIEHMASLRCGNLGSDVLHTHSSESESRKGRTPELTYISDTYSIFLLNTDGERNFSTHRETTNRPYR